MKIVLATVMAAAVAALLAVPAAHAAVHWNTFKTPSGHIHCEYGGGRLRCDVQNPQFKPPKHNCHGTGDFGFAFSLTRSGHGKGVCASDAVQPSMHTLHYGHVWSRNGITCHSHTNGLKCTNVNGHFFFLSQQVLQLG